MTKDAIVVDCNQELRVCLCKRCCEDHIKLKDILKMYPGIVISIRKEQLTKERRHVRPKV